MKNDKIKPAVIQNHITQRSQKIYQQTIKQPVSQIAPIVRKIGRNMDIARSKSIAHFAPHTPKPAVTIQPKHITAKKQFDIAPAKHPLITKANKLHSDTKKSPIQPAITPNANKSAKEQIIAEAFSKLANQQAVTNTKLKRKYKFINFFILGILLLIMIGYFVFINIPAISVNVASAQAGISATFPKYYPDGYSPDGPVSYSDRVVTINFKANTGPKKFTITQSKSSWDSTAVKSKINTDSKGSFSTTAENGLTIYTYDNNASWVNGGILYTITGDAPLSNSQIRHIATSL